MKRMIALVLSLVMALSLCAPAWGEGETVKSTLPEGVTEGSFGDNTVTDGTTYYATLQAAVQAIADAKTSGATLYCKPGADVGSLQHAPVTATLTVYGNGATVAAGGERDFDIGNTDPSGGRDITADMTLTVYDLDGCGAWGAKATEHTVNLVFENCKNMGKVFLTGTTGTLNITMTDCTFEGVLPEALYSNANGEIKLTRVAFSNLNKAVNLNHKAAGTQTVVLTGCTFTNCGNDVAADQIPVRVLTSVAGGSSVLTVSNCTFSGTPEGGADILLDYGVGTTDASVSGTAANVILEMSNNVGETTIVAATDSVSFKNYKNVAKVGDVEYKSLQEAVNAGGEVKLLENISLTNTVKITADKTVTLDLNGKVIDGVGAVRIALMSYGNLTLKDSSAAKTGAIKAGIGTAGNAVNICGGTFTMESGNIYSLNNGLLIDENASVVTIKGGKITAEPSTNNSAAFYISGDNKNVVNISGGEMVGYNGMLLWNNNEINIIGGSIEGKVDLGIQGNGTKDNTEINISGNATVSGKDAAIYHPQGGKLTIKDNAQVSGGTGIVVKGGTVNISGGTISGNGAAAAYAPVSSGYQSTGDGLYVEHYDNSSNSENYGTPVVTVTGGKFSSVNGKAVASYANPNNDVEALTAFISGGYFSTDVSNYVAEGYICAFNSDAKVYAVQKKGAATENGAVKEDVAENLNKAAASDAMVEAVEQATTNTVTVAETTIELTDEGKTAFQTAITNSATTPLEIETEIAISDVSNTMDSSVEDALETELKEVAGADAKVAAVLDIDIHVFVNDQHVGQLTELPQPITITLDLPEIEKELEDGYRRNYFVIIYHDGEAEKIPATVSGDKLVITSDRFSPYALGYVDVKVGGGYYPYNPTTPDKLVESAKTADPIGLYIGVTALATLGSALLLKKKED